MKSLFTSVLLIFCCYAQATTNITTPTVSGHWALSGSPFLIHNNIKVNTGDSLVIDPGVKVEFQGNYSLIALGTIQSDGTSALPIDFCVADTTGWSDPTILAGGWAGMKIDGGGSSFEYCNIRDIKGVQNDTCYGFWVRVPMVVKKCNFFHNTDRSVVVLSSTLVGGSWLMYLDAAVELDGCNIYDNLYDLELMWCKGINIHECKINNNHSGKLPESGNIVYSYAAGNNYFLNNQVSGNYAGASCLYMYAGNNSIKGNKIYDNYNGNDAALVCHHGLSVIDGNYICNNTDEGAACGINNGGGAIHIYNGHAGDTAINIIRNNIIANNYTFFRGAGVYVFQCNVLLANNQFINNKSHGDGAAVYCWGSAFGLGTTTIYIKNNLFFGNRTDSTSSDRGDISLGASADMNYAYDHNWLEGPNFVRLTTYMGGTVGYHIISDYTTNINGTNPGLAAPTTVCGTAGNALTADFSLLPASGCINKGDTAGINPGAIDYVGHTRVFGTSLDIGAYEYGAFPLGTIPPAINNAGKQLSIYPNPAETIVNIVTATACGKISITDISGRVALETEVTASTTQVDVASLRPGLYVVRWHGAPVATGTTQFVIK
jgi:hypothetical protein